MSKILQMLAPLGPWIIETIKYHGLPFLMLGMASWYFYQENEDRQAENAIAIQKSDDCYNEILRFYKTDHLATLEALNEYNKVMLKIERKL